MIGTLILSLSDKYFSNIFFFVFYRKTGHKKKVSSVVHFPQVLDMANYVQTSAGTSTYDLAAVLIHRGPSAYSGHYVGKFCCNVGFRCLLTIFTNLRILIVSAHIKDQASSSWYKFNDEVVEKLEGSEFQLGVEGDLEGNALSLDSILLSFQLTFSFSSQIQKRENKAAPKRLKDP